MKNKQLDETSKFMSYVLRHEPQAIGISLSTEGWVEIDFLIERALISGNFLSRDFISEIVSSSDKQRFSISGDGRYIRAVQGHTVSDVDIQHIKKEPPEFLYHGTATRFLDSIRQFGLIAGSRHHVHLSQDISTAIIVGQRHGKPAVLKVEALKMHQEGYKFYQADNGVWLTNSVPTDKLIPDSPLSI